MKEPLTQVHLHSLGMRTSLPEDKSDHSLVLTSKSWGKSLRQWQQGPCYRMGLPDQTVWHLVGTSYWDDPLNVVRPNTVNNSFHTRWTISAKYLCVSHVLLNLKGGALWQYSPSQVSIIERWYEAKEGMNKDLRSTRPTMRCYFTKNLFRCLKMHLIPDRLLF